MGLDISFNRKAAVDAGAQLRIVRNGTDEEIAEERATPTQDADYIEWLETEVEVLDVPNTEHCVVNDGAVMDIVVRANKWGRTYAPLTEWLKSNNIEWSEG